MAENTQVANTQNDGDISMRELLLSLGKWWRYLLSKWYIILSFGVLGGLLGIWYASVQKREYNATTTFVLETGEGGRASQFAGLAAMAGFDIGGGNSGLFQGENILELYKSRTMIERTLLSPLQEDGSGQLLIHRYLDFTGMRERWGKRPVLRNIKFNAENKYTSKKDQLLHDSIMGIVVKDIRKNNLEVGKIDKKLNIVSVQVKAFDELFAKSFNQQLVARVNDFYINTKTQKSLENVEILQRKADSVRGMMTGAIYQAARVADATPNVNPTRQTLRAAPMQSAQMSAEVNKAVLPDLVKNLEMSKISLSKETPLIQVVDEPILPLDFKKPGRLMTGIIGGVIAVLLVLAVLITRRMIRNILNDDPQSIAAS